MNGLINALIFAGPVLKGLFCSVWNYILILERRHTLHITHYKTSNKFIPPWI